MAEQDMPRIGMTEDDLAMQEPRTKRSDQAAAFASWLNSMRMKPDANLPAQLQAAQERRASNIRKNRTVNMLEAAGQTELAKQVASGAITGKTAVQQMFQLAAEERAAGRAAAASARSVENQMKLIDYRHEKSLELEKLKPSKTYQYQQMANDILAAGLADTPQEALKMALSKAQAGTTVNIGGGSNKQVFDAVAESADAAKKARTALKSLNQAQEATKGMIAGVGAEQRLQLAKLATFTGFGNFDEAIQDTETFKTQIAPQVAFLLKQTVGSTQVSDQDRKFAQQAAAGDITFDKNSLIRVLNIMEKMSQAVVENHNTLLNSVYPEGQGFERERSLFGVVLDGGASAAPSLAAKPEPVGEIIKMPDGTTIQQVK